MQDTSAISAKTTIPHLSVITSWNVPLNLGANETVTPSIKGALNAGIPYLDLYFLDHVDIPIYCKMLNIEGKSPVSPTEFVASLSPQNIAHIAKHLKTELVESFKGKLVGKRPRYTAIATFFDGISSSDTESSQLAIKALQNTLALAHYLGCPCVEIVAGSIGNSETSSFDNLIQNLNQVLSEVKIMIDGVEKLLETPPKLALEIEPGVSFLMNSLKAYQNFLDRAEALKSTWVKTHALLNLDIAHSFLLGYTPENYKEYTNRIAHVHISDHTGHGGKGGNHAADLIPGEFHPKQVYIEWIKFILQDLMREDNFSKVVAIELEACNDIGIVMHAITTVQSWLQEESPDDAGEWREGLIVAVDVGNSTLNFLSSNQNTQGVKQIERLIVDISLQIFHYNGMMLNYTGDGFIALFEKPLDHKNLLQALNHEVERIINEPMTNTSLTLRTALHWGTVYTPSKGILQEQAIGADVVCVARLCDWLSKTIEPAQPHTQGHHILGMTHEAYQNLPENLQSEWLEWNVSSFKGLDKQYTLYLHQSIKG